MTSIAFGEQSTTLQEIDSVTAEVTVSGNPIPATPAVTPTLIPFVTPTLIPVFTPPTMFPGMPAENPVVTPAELPLETPAALPAVVGDQASPLAAGSEVSRGSSTARLIIDNSLRFLGSPYRYGGTTAQGFDCSGFVSHVFSMADIKLPRSSREQATVGTHVDKDKLVPADLVFFKTGGSSRINHVGIYLGDGRFIHASTKQGIVITSLNSKYYLQNYYGARRILE